MGPGYFILAIMGCGDGATMCEQIALRETTFRSETACMAETESALDEAMDQPFPLLLADCRRVRPQTVETERRRDSRPAS